MKKRILIISFIIPILVSSCNYVDYNESSYYTQDLVFSTFTNTRQAINAIYGFIPADGYGMVGSALRSAACDEAVYIDRLSTVHDFNNGSWTAANALDNQWANFYRGIRMAHLFLDAMEGRDFEDFKGAPDYEANMGQVHYYQFEARFLRAYFYFELAKRYGDVPLVTKMITEEEALQLSRTPFNEVIQFIVDECDRIAPELPINYRHVYQAETGRATRAMAMALKSKALLYAASNLYNTNKDKEKWKKAAQAAADYIVKANIAQPPTPTPGEVFNDKNYGFGHRLPALGEPWFLNHSEVTNPELILGRMRPASNSFERQNYPTGITGGGSTGHCPTQNLVDAYEMKATGLPISNKAGYQTSDPAYNPQNPYAGRDPRLENAIVINNSIWPTQYGERVEIWEGGNSGFPVNRATSTGYYLKKYVDGTCELRPGRNESTRRRTWVILRYAEILLNYAEAMVEAYGDYNKKDDGVITYPLSAREAVNLVRTRAGVDMPPFPDNLSIEEFILKLRNERRIELAFEDQRFWDIRRWKIAGNGDVNEIRGVKITRKADNSFEYNYNSVVENRVWDDKMYLYPIPQAEIFKSPSLTQNPGW